MKHIKTKLSLITLLLFLLGNEAVSQISASQTQGCAPLIGVELSHSFGSVSGILWTFGNGTSAVVDNPTANYQDPGVYTVTFTANGGISETLTITVLDSPEASFTIESPEAGCIPLNVDFQDQSTPAGGTPIVSWSWDFGDGGVLSGAEPSPSHVYTLVGINDVALVVEDANGCEGSFVMNDVIIASTTPDLDLISGETSACTPPLSVQFSADASSNSPNGNNLDYFWDLGDGTTSTSANIPEQNYPEEGNWVISVTVTDDAGCSATQATAVNVGSPEAGLELIGGPNFCDEVTFVNWSDPANTTINYGNGQTANVPVGTDTITYTYNSSGDFTATITTNSPGCSNSAEVNLTIDEVVANFTSSPTFSCDPTLTTVYEQDGIGGVDFMWVFGLDTLYGPSVEYTHVNPAQVDPYFIQEGPTMYGGTLIVTSPAGCTDEISISNDSIWPPSSAFAVDVSLGCAPLTVNFADSSFAPTDIVQWDWHMGNGDIITTYSPDIDTSYTYTTDGDFESFLVITTTEGCVDTSFNILIEVGAEMATDLDFGPLQVCPGEPIDFEAIIGAGNNSDMWSIQSDNGQLSGCPYTSDANGGFSSEAGFHDVTIISSYNGCLSTVTYEDAIEVLGPVGHFYTEYNCDDPYTIDFELNVTGSSSWTLEFGDGQELNTTSDQSTSHTYASTGDYTATLTSYSGSGCPPFVEEIDIKIRDISASLADLDPFCAGDQVTLDASGSEDVFTECSSGYLWILPPSSGEPTIRTETSSISFQMNQTGSFEFSLVVEDFNGCTDTVTSQFDVFGVDAEIEYELVGECIPMVVDISNQSTADTTIVFWEWDIDGQITTSVSDTTITFDNNFNAPYIISLQVKDTLGCIGHDEVVLTPDIPTASFNVGNAELCAGESFTLSASSTEYAQYEWFIEEESFGDDASIEHEISEQGQFDITLVVTNDVGCTDTLTQTSAVTVQQYPDVGFSSTADDLENLCYPILIEFTDTTNAWIFDYRTWDLGTGFPVVDNQTVGTIYDEPGIYNVSLEVGTTFGCVSTFETQLEIEGPVGEFVLSEDQICIYESVFMEITDTSDVSTFMWDFGNGETEPMVNPVEYTYNVIPVGGATNVQLIMWSADSICSATAQLPLMVNQTIADFDRNNEVALEDTVHCFGLLDVFTSNSIDANQYYWELGNGASRNGETVNYYYPEGGFYDITLYASNDLTGCSDTITKSIQVYPEMVVGASNGLACTGDTLHISAFGGETYQWSPANVVFDANSPSTFLTSQENEDLTIQITDTNDCSQVLDVYAHYIFGPDGPEWNDTIIDYGTQLELLYTQEEYHNYDWFYENGSTCDYCGTAFFYPDADDVIGLVITDELNCFVDTFYMDVTVLSDLLFYMPNAFSPNHDGINDLFHPVMTRALAKDYRFMIWNRNGELIWDTEDINAKWNGAVEGEDHYSQPEVYVWKVVVKDLKSIAHEFVGHVTLLR